MQHLRKSRLVGLSSLAAVLLLAACSVKKYADEEGPAPATADPWLRSLAASDCPQAACLFALVVDGNNQPISGAEVSIEGTGVNIASDSRGRIIAEGVPFGSRKLRVTTSGVTLQSDAVALGRVYTSLVIEVQSDRVVLKR